MLSVATPGVTLLIDAPGISGERVAFAMARGGAEKRPVRIVGRRSGRLAGGEEGISWLSPDGDWKSGVKGGGGDPLILTALAEWTEERGVQAVVREVASIAASTPLIAVVHADLLTPLDIARIASVAERVIELSPLRGASSAEAKDDVGKVAARVKIVKRNGTVQDISLVLSLTPTGGLREERTKEEGKVSPETTPAPTTSQKPRNIEVNKGDVAMQLPYAAARTEEGLVAIHGGSSSKIRVGGRVIYAPDDGDDLDDSDPDDDLHI